MPYLLALDQGTTSSRAIIFNERAQVCAQAQQELLQHFPQPGWVEHDAEQIWHDQLTCAQQALQLAKLETRDISAIGMTNQRETLVLWDRASGKPLSRAIVWQDRRTAEHCARLKADGYEAELQARSGLLLDPYFSASKLAWMLDTLPGARARAEKSELACGTIDCWLIWNLTGGKVHATDISNASRTALLNIHTGEWDDALLRMFNIPRAVLPQVAKSSGLIGRTDPALFGSAIPIAGVAGDQQAALFGQACHQAGMAKNTYGTGCFLLLHTGDRAVRSQQRLLTTCAAQTGSTIEYALEGSVFIGGAVVQWLRDALGIIQKSSEVEALAASVSDSGGVSFVPAFTGLGAPHWEPRALGLLSGLSRGTTRAHIARAALEAIALQSVELVRAMEADMRLDAQTHNQNHNTMQLTELRVDGGATANNLLMQMQTDLLGVPVVRAQVQETTALGAAYLAGLATGVWSSTQDIARHWQAGARFTPILESAQAQRQLSDWQKSVRACVQLSQP